MLYRDQGDEYVTRVVNLTSDIHTFTRALRRIKADGGGDTPEDLQSALNDALHRVHWNKDGLRLGFIITDAPPHLYDTQDFNYIEAAKVAKGRGIKLFSVGTGGLDIQGEYILRQISQLTYAKYLFLTFGEKKGDSQGGRPGSVSHHTGSNYQTDRLEAIIIKLANEEVAWFTDKELYQGDDYFEAHKIEDESREETLSLLFSDAVDQLVDYASFRIEDKTKLGVLPLILKTKAGEVSAEYFSEQLILSVSTNKQFVLVSRKNLQDILDEQKLQLSGLIDETTTMEVGALLGAELLMAGELYEKQDSFELFLKLLRVETGEILSVTKLVLDRNLGL